MKQTIRIDSLGIDVPDEHPRQEGPVIGEGIHVQVHDNSLWLWCWGCNLGSEIYLFVTPPDVRLGRGLAEMPHTDVIYRTLTEHYISQRNNIVGTHLQHGVRALESVIAERDGSSVYFAAAGGRLKIGWSKKVSQRLSQLRTGSAVPISLIGTVPGGRARERHLHEQFAHLRVSGEWFDATPELIDHVTHLVASARSEARP